MKLPTVLFIGPMKAGTSWVHEYLSRRGDVCLPAGVKETFFFDYYYGRGWRWYGHHFRHHDPVRHRQVIEVAPSLFHDPDAPHRVKALLGEVPLIVTVRDPVARSWSHYLHLRRKGYTRDRLQEATARFPEIVSASRYERQIARWKGALPGSEVTVLSLEALVESPEDYVRSICQALSLELRRAPPELPQPSNVAGYPYSYLLARLGRHGAAAVRAAGGYGFVNFAKRCGMKEIFFGPPASPDARPELTKEDADWLRKSIANPY